MSEFNLHQAPITVTETLVNHETLYHRENDHGGILSVQEKLSRRIPPGLEVHNNHYCKKAEVIGYWTRAFLFWTEYKWVLVFPRWDEGGKEGFDHGVEEAGRWWSS